MTQEQLDTIAWLNRAYYASKKVIAIAAQRDTLRELAQCVGGHGAGNDKGKSDGRQNGTEMALMRLCEIDGKLQDEMNSMIPVYSEIETVIKTVDDVDMESILRLRYLAFETMENISEKLNYDRSTVKRKHKAAVSKVAPLCPCLPP